jgi:hypothetical protein
MVEDGYTLFQEVDYFFNYLYHDHPQTPSKKMEKMQHLNSYQIKQRLRKYFEQLKKHYPKNKQDWRLERVQTIKKLLPPSRINDLNWEDIKEITKCLHCYSSYPLNRTKFLNPQNNTLENIIKKWDTLLHTGDITSEKIKATTDSLRFFGKSSIQQLIGWYYPDKYPIMNSNSDCGMRFFGYDI